MWNNWISRLLAEIILGIGLALLVRRFVCVFAWVKGMSMRETLQNKEVIFALRRPICRELKRFDVVLCRYPKRKGMFVKRIVALPGERVALMEGALKINGEAMLENFPLRVARRDMEEQTVPDGAYFVMGDNRPSSSDSRRVGAIADQDIIAVAKWVVFPLRCARKI